MEEKEERSWYKGGQATEVVNQAFEAQLRRMLGWLA